MSIQEIALFAGQNLIMGLLVFKAIDFAKLSEAFPWLTPERTALIRSINIGLSSLAVVLVAFAENRLSLQDSQSMVTALVNIAIVWSVAHGTHKINKASER